MIDSIKLAIPTNQVTFNSYTGYKGVSEDDLKTLIDNNGYLKGAEYVHYEKEYISNQGYLPAVGVCAYLQHQPMLWLRFSAPKLLFKTNMIELEEADFNNLVAKIRSTASTLGIDIPLKAIEDSCIWEVHVGKNVDLNPTGMSCECVLSALNKLAFDARFNIRKGNYINFFGNTLNNIQLTYEEGEKFDIFCKSFGYCCYNKTQEVIKDSYGKDFIKHNPRFNNVLRLEYRLFFSESVKRAFSKVGIPQNITFKDFFTDDNFQKLNVFIWTKLMADKIIWLSFLGNDPMVFLSKMKTLNIKPVQRLKLLGVYFLLLTEGSCRTIKTLFPAKSNIVRRLEKQMEDIQELASHNLLKAFKYIEAEIKRNKPLI